MKLWRPVGPKELELIKETSWKSFPPRLPEQPVFYPVMNFEYAEQIARDWNSNKKDNGFRGYVTEFDVSDDYASQFDIQTVGGSKHKELWVPSEELKNFNSHIDGKILVVAEYHNKTRVR